MLLLRVAALFRLVPDFFFVDDFEREDEPARDVAFVFVFDLVFDALLVFERVVADFDFARVFAFDFDLVAEDFAVGFDLDFEPELLAREAVFLRAPLFRVLLFRRDDGRRDSEDSPCSSSPSSSEPISFFATPTAGPVRSSSSGMSAPSSPPS